MLSRKRDLLRRNRDRPRRKTLLDRQILEQADRDGYRIARVRWVIDVPEEAPAAGGGAEEAAEAAAAAGGAAAGGAAAGGAAAGEAAAGEAAAEEAGRLCMLEGGSTGCFALDDPALLPDFAEADEGGEDAGAGGSGGGGMSVAADGSVEAAETEEERLARHHRETEALELRMPTAQLRRECLRMVQCWLLETGPTNWNGVIDQLGEPPLCCLGHLLLDGGVLGVDCAGRFAQPARGAAGGRS